jgi:hypothetical protein
MCVRSLPYGPGGWVPLAVLSHRRVGSWTPVDPQAGIFILFLGSAIESGFTPCMVAPLSLELPFEANEASKTTKS